MARPLSRFFRFAEFLATFQVQNAGGAFVRVHRRAVYALASHVQTTFPDFSSVRTYGMATDSHPSRGGPKTAIGRARASQNATKHGLLAKAPVLVTEDRADFTAFTTALIDQMAPVGPYEELLAARVAEAAWRLRRIGPLEVELFTYERERIRTESNGAAFASNVSCFVRALNFWKLNASARSRVTRFLPCFDCPRPLRRKQSQQVNAVRLVKRVAKLAFDKRLVFPLLCKGQALVIASEYFRVVRAVLKS